MTDILLNGPPMWLSIAWFSIGPVAAYIGFRRWCCCYKRDFGYFRGSDLVEGVIVVIFGLLVGPLMLAFIGLDDAHDWYCDSVKDKKFFIGRKWK